MDPELALVLPKGCQPNPDPGETMRIAPATTCMQCHAAVKTDSPAIQKLAAVAKEGREIRWARVYQIPPYVFFSHRSCHREKKASLNCSFATSRGSGPAARGILAMPPRMR